MPTTNFHFKKAEDAPNFPKASSQDYNQNLDTLDSALSDPFFSASITPDTNYIVDSVDASGNIAIKWIIYVEDEAHIKQSFIEVSAITNGTTVNFLKYGHVHITKVNFDVNVDIEGNTLRLNIHNNENATISINGRRLSPFLKVVF